MKRSNVNLWLSSVVKTNVVIIIIIIIINIIIINM